MSGYDRLYRRVGIWLVLAIVIVAFAIVVAPIFQEVIGALIEFSMFLEGLAH